MEKAEAEHEAKMHGFLRITSQDQYKPPPITIDPSIPKPPTGKKRFVDFLQGVDTPAARRKSMYI